MLQRSSAARWSLALVFAALGLLGLAAAVASGLLTLPGGVLFCAVAVWLATGADDPPTPGLKWTMAVSAGVVVAMLAAGVVIAVMNNV